MEEEEDEEEELITTIVVAAQRCTSHPHSLDHIRYDYSYC